MSPSLRLEDFGTPQHGPKPADAAAPGVTAPDDALAAYEAGYKSGWEDCSTAEADAHRRIGADLAANLQDLSLTYAEARQEVLSALGPLFEEIAATLLPTLVAEAVAPTVAAELEAAARTASAPDITVMAAPGVIPTLEKLADTHPALEVTLRAEPAYAEGQVSITFAGQSHDIDLADAAAHMAEAIRAFTTSPVTHPVSVGAAS